MCCRASQVTSAGVCCPSGQIPGATDKSQCVPATAGTSPPQPTPTGGAGSLQCCMPGSILAADGTCCSIDLLTRSGVCCPEGRPPEAGGTSCGPGPAPQQVCQGTMINGECCPPGQATPAGPNQKCCPPRSRPDLVARLGCAPLPTEREQPTQCCSAGLIPARNGSCCAPDLLIRTGTCCPEGQRPDADGLNCVASCAPGYRLSGQLCVRERAPPRATARKLIPAPPLPPRVAIPEPLPAPSPRLVPSCGPRERLVRGVCVCDPGFTRRGGLCVPVPARQPVCGPREHLSDGVCECDRGLTKVRGICIAVRQPEARRERACEPNEHMSDGVCECNQGFTKVRGVCVPRGTELPTEASLRSK